MIRIGTILLVTLAALSMAAASLPALAVERSQVPEKLTWNLKDLYPTDAAWSQAKETLQKRLPDMAPYKGHLGDSARSLYKALSTMAGMDKDLARLMSYASQLADQDTRVSRSQEMVQGRPGDRGFARRGLRAPRDPLPRSGEGGPSWPEPRLKDYKLFLDNILRRKAHTLEPGGREARGPGNGQMAGPEAIYSIFTNADFPYPEVTLSARREGPARRGGLHQVPGLDEPRRPREGVQGLLDAATDEFKRTLGTTLYSEVKAHIFNQDVHKFGSSPRRGAVRRNNSHPRFTGSSSRTSTRTCPPCTAT